MATNTILPSEIRRSLLADHARIERLLEELEDLADRARTGDHSAGRFEAVAHQLRRMLDAHNAAEEEALEPLLRVVDSWGAIRVEGMFLEHQKEHAEMLATLDAPSAELAAAIPGLASDLRAHMTREERTFLSGEVLRDDIISAGPTS
jgi:hemerythrin-like domain-containing protein